MNINKLKDIISRYNLEILVVLLMVVYLFPIIQSVLFSDDAFIFLNSLIDNKIIGDDSWLFKAKEETITWALNSGRIAPLFYFTNNYLLYNLNPISVKLIYYVGTLLAIFIGCYTISKLFEYNIFSLLLLFCIGSVQFCIRYHDSYNSFGLLYPCIVIFNFSSLYFANTYLSTMRNLNLYISLAFFLVSLFFQEISLIFLPIHMVLYWWKSKSIKHLIPYFVIAGLYFLLFCFMRLSVDTSTQYSGLKSVFDFKKNIYVFYSQFLGGIPLRNTFCTYFDFDLYCKLLTENWLQVLFMFIVSFFVLWRQFNIKTIQSSNYIIVIGFMLLLLPALSISFSAKYIEEISESKFYIPVFIQIFGSALLLGVLFLRFYWGRIFILIVFPSIICLSFLTNKTEIEKGKRIHTRHSLLLKKLEQSDKILKPGDTLLTYNLWTEDRVVENLMEQYFKKKIICKKINELDSNSIYSNILIYRYDDTLQYEFKRKFNLIKNNY